MDAAETRFPQSLRGWSAELGPAQRQEEYSQKPETLHKPVRAAKTKQPDVYENIVIGNFLFGLGVKIGFLHSDAPSSMLPMSVNLLQQTRLDERFSDVLVHNPMFLRLIEFKRFANVSDKEARKRNQLKKALKADTHLQSVSRKVHWYVESTLLLPELKVRFVPYLDFLAASASPEFKELSNFVEVIAREASAPSVDDQQIQDARDYLKLLESVWKSKRYASSSSGVLVLHATAQGDLQYRVLENIRELFLTERELRLELDRRLGRERRDIELDHRQEGRDLDRHRERKDLDHRLEHRDDREHQLNRGIDRGFER
jgi:hypothetical protein